MTSVVPATSQHLWATKPATFPQAMHQLMHWAELRKTDTLRIQAELVKPRKATNPIFLNHKSAAKKKVKNLQKIVDEWESPSKDWFHFKGMVQPVHELSSLQGKHTNLRSWEHSWLRLFDQQSGKAAELFYLLKAWGRVGQNEQTSDPTQKNSDLPPPPNLKRPPDLPPRPTCRTPQTRQSRQGIKQRDTGVTASRSRARGEQEGRGKWQAVRAKHPL